MSTVADYQRAERELTVREPRRGWVIHATIYAGVNARLITLNVTLVATTNASFFWFPFPLVGWSVGVTMHYLYSVRWAERDIHARQRKIERLASETPSHADTS